VAPESPTLLFVNQHYLPDAAATGQQLADLAEYLVRHGYEVDVLCGSSRYAGGQLRAPREEVLRGVTVQRLWTTGFPRLWTTRFSRLAHAGRLLNYALFYLQALMIGLFGRGYERVIYLTTPPLLSFLGYLAYRLRGRRYAIWSMDLHPDAEVAAGMLREGGLPARLLRRLNAAAYRSADFVVALGPYMRDRIAAYGVRRERLHTVHMWSLIGATEADPRARPHDDAASSVRELAVDPAWEGRIVVMYSGNAGLAHGFGEILEAIRRLKDDERFCFIFIGDGPRRPMIEAFVRQNEILNFRYLDYFPQADIAHSLAIADIHLITLRREFAGISVPVKLYGIMAAARPTLFLGPSACETADSIREGSFGAVIDPDRDPDPASTLVRTLLEWAADPETRAAMGDRARQSFLAHHTRELCCAEFEDVIRRWTAPPCC